jgi:hypothetical protein
LIIGVGSMNPREFFNIARIKGIDFDWNKTAVVSRLDNLGRFYETHSHVIYFDIPETLVRVSPLHRFDFCFHGFDQKVNPVFSEKRPVWALVRYCASAPRDKSARPIVSAKLEILNSIIKANKRNDVLDKLNLITYLLSKASARKKAERYIISYLMGEYNLKTVVAKLHALNSKDRSFELAVAEFAEWTKLPVKDHLISALSELLKKPDSWRDNILHVSEAFGIRHFELGYIMSFLERQKA